MTIVKSLSIPPSYDFEAFVRALPEGRPLLGIDLGTKNIGLAVSDVDRRIATPHYTVRRKDQKKDLGRIWQVATERNVCGIVLGMPMNMDGSDGPRTQAHDIDGLFPGARGR